MDPINQMLSPFVPQAMLVVALVAFVRYALSKRKVDLDGWPVVLLAALLSAFVCLWTQRRVGAVDWMKLALDAPAVLILSAGGTAWAKRLRGAPKSESDTNIAEAVAIMSETLNTFGAQPVKADAKMDLNVDGSALARATTARPAVGDLTAEDFSFTANPDPDFPEAAPSPPAPATP